MKSKYEPLGKYIRLVDERNSARMEENLLGVSTQKYFIPSIANTVGTDFSKYKVVRRGQFTYVPDTSRRGDRIAIALLQDWDEGLVSNIYTVFEVTDIKKLSPEYLMLWFKRPEFDRYARFKSHGSVREVFDWDELCTVTLPVPSLERQLAIVRAYQVIANRIELKWKINDNLLATGICVLDQFLNSTNLIDSTETDIDNIELPDEWTIMTIANYANSVKSGSTPSRAENLYWKDGTIPWLKSGEVHNNITISTEESITELGLRNSSTNILPPDTVLMALYGVTAGEVGYLAVPAATNQAICGMVCDNKTKSAFLYFYLLYSQKRISRLSNGGAQNNLSKAFIENIKMIVPPQEVIEKIGLTVFVQQLIHNTMEIAVLVETETVLLSNL